MGFLVVGQLRSLGSGECRVESLGGGRGVETVRVGGAPEAGTAVTSVTLLPPLSLHLDTEAGRQSACQSARRM